MFGWVRKAVYDKLFKRVAYLEYELADAQLTAKVCRKLWYKAADERDDEKRKVTSLQREVLKLRAGQWSQNKPKQSSGAQFTQDELRSLLQLVHPDKHGGKASAVTLTQKINQLRN